MNLISLVAGVGRAVNKRNSGIRKILQDLPSGRRTGREARTSARRRAALTPDRIELLQPSHAVDRLDGRLRAAAAGQAGGCQELRFALPLGGEVSERLAA